MDPYGPNSSLAGSAYFFSRKVALLQHSSDHLPQAGCWEYIALQDMPTFKNQAKIMLPFLVTLLLIKVSNCAQYMFYMKMMASSLATSGYQP